MKLSSLLFLITVFALTVFLLLQNNEDRSIVDAASDVPHYESVELPFTSDSWWNTPLPADAPVHPDSDSIIAHIREHNGFDGEMLLSGTDGGGTDWGKPKYVVDENDPVYNVKNIREGVQIPPEFESLRIPRGAEPQVGDDYEMVIYDPEKNYAAMLWRARYDEESDTWTVEGGTVAYLDSNGLDYRVEGGDPRNSGTGRGRFGPNTFIHRHELDAGKLRRVHKINIVAPSTEHVWPMYGSDGRSTAKYAPPQGTRLRIKPHINLDDYNLEPQARIIAENLQHYGAVIADVSGWGVSIKMERSYENWPNSNPYEIRQRALRNIPIEDFEVIEHEYQVTGHSKQ